MSNDVAWVEALRRITTSASATEAADRVASMASDIAGYRGVLLTLATPDGICIGAHGLTEDERAHFRQRGHRASLAERRANRARLRERAFPGTGIVFVQQASSDFHVLTTPAERGAEGSFGPDDVLYVMVRGCDGQDIGVLSLDAPLDGRAPSAHDLGTLPRVEELVNLLGPVLEARMAREASAEREGLLLEAQRLDLLGRVAFEVAHDLNNLMTVVIGTASLAQELSTDERTRRLMDDAIHAADRAAALAHRLLGAGRTGPPGPQTTDLVGVVVSLEPPARRMAATHLAVRLDAAEAPVATDPGRLTQVVLNLVANARDAGASVIQVRVDTFDERGVAFVRLTVSDDGRGMEPEVRERIFDAFYTTRPDGSGIGLATVRRIVGQLEGRIRVDSAPGQGSTFTVELPRA